MRSPSKVNGNTIHRILVYPFRFDLILDPSVGPGCDRNFVMSIVDLFIRITMS